MSTRSGKRIHSSFHENALKSDEEHVVQSERKTRSRRFEENIEELTVSVLKTKKRSNYVSYPTDEEVGTDTVNSKGEGTKSTRALRKNALKEQNYVTPSTESVDPPTDILKPLRTTRRTRKVSDAQENLNHVENVVHEGSKSKKAKKKKKSIPDDTAEEVVIKKKTKKKVKKAKRSGSMVVEDIVPENGEKATLNRSDMSVDSFHSAAGSPPKYTQENTTSAITSPVKEVEVATALKTAYNITHKPEGRQLRSVARISRINISQSTSDSVVKVSRKRKSSFKDLDTAATGDESLNKNTELKVFDTTLTNTTKKRKSSIRDTVSKKTDIPVNGEIKDSTFDLEDLEQSKSVVQAEINTTYDKSETPKSDITFNKTLSLDKNTTCEKDQASTCKVQTPQSKLNTTNEKSNYKSPIDLVTDITKEKPAINTTFEKDDPIIDSVSWKSAIINSTFEKDDPIIDSVSRKSAIINTTYEKDSDNDTEQDPKVRKSSIINDTYDKNDVSSDILSETEDSNINLRKSTQKAQQQMTKMNSTTEKSDSTLEKEKIVDSTFDKDNELNTTFDKNSKSSLISTDSSNITLDKSEVSRISITSDDSKDNIINTTPVLIESSLDESHMNMSKFTKTNETPLNSAKFISPSETNSRISPETIPITPLKREGTFTKDCPDITEAHVNLLTTPTRKMSLPSPGCTPFPNKSASKISMMNVTRSLEKSRRSSLSEPLPRATRVMFCSPVNNPIVEAQQRRKVIKSNLKGSNKSFVFEDGDVEPRAARRKRSYTHNDAEAARVKRNRFADGAQTSLGRQSRARTTSATEKPTDPGTPSKRTATTPKKSEAKISRTKLPNFAALHQREFAKMESLGECQERKARRAKQLLTPTGAVNVLERSSPREPTETKKTDEEKKSPNLAKETPKEHSTERRSKNAKKPETPIKSLPTLKSLNPGYTRFGFKLNYDVNPFNITCKSDKNSSQVFSSKKNTVKRDLTRPLKEIRGLKRQATLSSLPGTSAREVAKQTVMREKSFTDKTEKRNKTRNENRTVIKGVRTNRRFDLQMRMRNMD